jgi:hypothetical protein
MGSKVRPINATSSWAKGLGREIHIDTVDWPNNKPCARKASPAPGEVTLNGNGKKYRVIKRGNLLKQ